MLPSQVAGNIFLLWEDRLNGSEHGFSILSVHVLKVKISMLQITGFETF